MTIKDWIKNLILRLAETIHNRRKAVLALSCLVVFVTTYLLILPAFTLEKEKAAEQGGITVPVSVEDASDQSGDADEISGEAGDLSDPGEDESVDAKDNSRDTEAKGAASSSNKEDAAESSGSDADDKGVTDDSAEKSQDTGSDAGQLTFEGEGYSIEILDDKSVLPADTEVSASELDPQSSDKTERKTYEKFYDEALQTLKDEKAATDDTEVSFARLYDISLLSGGETIEPDDTVGVRISYDQEERKDLKVEDEHDLHIVHITEDKNGKLKSEIIDKDDVDVTLTKNNRVKETEFQTDGFSVYAIVYTVDFHYEVNGKKYDFSLPGGGFVSLKDLVEVLGIAGTTNSGQNANDDTALTLGDVEVSEDTEKFVRQVEKVEFSDPSLVSVSKVEKNTTVGAIKDGLGLECEYSAELTKKQINEIDQTAVEAGDWALISLKAFDTEETLTVTMKKGDVLTIRVTDAQAGDAYGLHGKTYVITNGNRALKAQAVQNSTTRLQSAAIASDDNLKWTFEYDESAFDGEGGYYLVNELNGEKRYLNVTAEGVGLVNEKNREETDAEGHVTITPVASPLSVSFSEKTGSYRLSADKNGSSRYLTFSSSNYGSGNFGVGDTTTDVSKGEGGTWFKLRDPADPSGKPGTVGTWDILSDEITLKLFNYSGTTNGKDWNNNVEERDIDKFYGSRVTEEWLRSGTGVNNGRTLLFSGSGLNNPDINGENKISWYNEFTGVEGKTDSKYSVLTQPGIVSHLLNKDGFPVLSSSYDWQQKDKKDGGSLGYLFGAGGQSGVTAYEGTNGKGLNGLLRKDDEGYYYYDSEANYAKLNDAKDEIILYSDTYNKSDASVLLKKEKIGFFPFNEYNSNAKEEKTPAGGSYDHQFGLSLETNFVYPKNGIVPDTEQPMIFEFSGDDDVWVFVDGVLVLDLGGVHQPVDGKIDFSTGEVTIVEERADGGAVTSHNTTIEEMFQKASQEAGKKITFDTSEFSSHKFSFFYLERGGCDSNMSIKFNLLISKTLTLAKKLNGLTPKEQSKYIDDDFLYELAFRHNRQGIDINLSDESDVWEHEDQWRTGFDLYNTANDSATSSGNHTIYRHRDGTEEAGVPIKDGQITLKAGESMTVTHLPRTDIFYVAEEDQLDMDQFEVPHAERTFIDVTDQEEHEEEIHLHEDHAQESHHKDDWETKPYALMDTEKVVYTNTLQEKNLDVKKTWSDGNDKHDKDPVTFQLQAKVINHETGAETDYSGSINAQWSQTKNSVRQTKTENVFGNNEKFTLSKDNGWEMSFEHLPKITEHDDEIVYTVKEVKVKEGYTSTISDVTDKDEVYLDLAKFWPDDSVNHSSETINTKVKNQDGKYIVAEQQANGEYKFVRFADTFDEGTDFTLSYHSGTDDSDKMMDYAARINGVPKAKENGSLYEYTLKQDGDSNLLTTGLVIFNRPVREVEILNDQGKITVEKKWVDEDGNPLSEHPENITFKIYQLQHVHDWGDWTVEKAASDIEEGIEVRVCKYDSTHRETRPIAKLPHVHEWGSGEVTTEPTCTTEGVKTYTCKCGESYTESIPALGHKYVEGTPQNPTCTEEGYRIDTCSRCGDTKQVKTDDALGHDYVETVIKAATCTEAGSKTVTCSRCDYNETVTIPATGHDWSEWVDNGNGTETRTCNNDHDNSHPETRDKYTLYPGTRIIVQDYTWPNTGTTLQPGGIFKYGNEYWVIVKSQTMDAGQLSGGPSGNAHSWDVTVKISSNARVFTSSSFISGTGYDKNSNQRSDMIEGDIYLADDGKYYVYKDKNGKWSKNPSDEPSKWYLIPESTYAPETSSQSVSSQGMRKRLNIVDSSLDKSVGSDVNASKPKSAAASGTGINVTTTNLTLEQLMADLNIEALDADPNDQGNVLHEYTTSGITDLATPVGEDTSWAKDIPVKRFDESGVEYRYFIVEDLVVNYETKYEGQSAGLVNDGKVTITNKYLTTEVKFKKDWQDIDGNEVTDKAETKVIYTLFQVGETASGEVLYNDDYVGKCKVSRTVDGEAQTDAVEGKSDFPVTFTVTHNSPVTISGLPKEGVIDGQKVTYKYYALEEASEELDGYSASIPDAIAEGDFTIINKEVSPASETTDVKVKKVWVGDDADKDRGVRFKLVQERAELPKDGNDKYTFYPATLRIVNGDRTVKSEEVYYVKKGQNLQVNVTKKSANPGRVKFYSKWETIGGNSYTNNYGVHGDSLFTVQLEPGKSWGTDWTYSVRGSSGSVKNSAYDFIKDLSIADTAFQKTGKEIYINMPTKGSAEADGGQYNVTPVSGEWAATVNGLQLYEKVDGKYYTYRYRVEEVSIIDPETQEVIETVANSADGTSGSSKNFDVSYDPVVTYKNGKIANIELQITNTKKNTATIKIVKIEKGNDTSKTLAGAKFKLVEVDEQHHKKSAGTEIGPKEVDGNGIVTFEDLTPGIYEITETETPIGYILKEGPYYIEVKDADNTKLSGAYTMAFEDENVDGTYYIQNEPGVALPSTGGPGTGLFYILGSILVIGAGLMLKNRSRI